MTDMLHMKPELMSTPRLREKRYCRNPLRTLDHRIITDRFFPFTGRNDLSHIMVFMMLTYLSLNNAFFKLHFPFHKGYIFLFDRMRLELFGQTGVSKIRFSDQNNTGCFFIQPVNDPRTLGAVTVGKRRKMMHQHIDQRTTVIPGSRMDRHAEGFIDRDDLFIFKNNIQRHILGLDTLIRIIICLNIKLNNIPGLNGIASLDRFSIDGHAPALDQAFDEHTRWDNIRQCARHININAQVMFKFCNC